MVFVKFVFLGPKIKFGPQPSQ